MNKLLSTIGLLFILTTFAFGQARVRWKEQAIRNDFPARTFDHGYTDKGVKWISFDKEIASTIYYFDDNGTCNLCAVFPHTQKILNGLVEKYNKEYVIVSDTKWKMYSGNGNMYIELKLKDEGYYFISY